MEAKVSSKFKQRKSDTASGAEGAGGAAAAPRAEEEEEEEEEDEGIKWLRVASTRIRESCATEASTAREHMISLWSLPWQMRTASCRATNLRVRCAPSGGARIPSCKNVTS